MGTQLQFPLSRRELSQLESIRGKLAADNAADFSDETLKAVFGHCAGRDIDLLAMQFRDAGISLAVQDQPSGYYASLKYA